MPEFWDGENQLPTGVFTPRGRRIPWGWITFFGFIALTFVLLAFCSVHYAYIGRIVNVSEVMPRGVTIILGAGVKEDGTPSDALLDRLKTGAMIYKYGYTRSLLVTGDDGAYHAKEVEVMKKTLIELGVPTEHIYVDPHGYRTYESCKRAIQTYHVNEAIIVTQRFHLPRALFLCNELGLESIGVSADLQKYQKESYFEFREFFASIKAFMDIYIHAPKTPVKYPAGE